MNSQFTTTSYKKLYWSLQNKIKNDEFYSENRELRAENKKLLDKIEELEDIIDEFENTIPTTTPVSMTFEQNKSPSTHTFSRGSNVIKRDNANPISNPISNHTRCIADKPNGSRCRQCGKDTQSGGPIINNYCKYHR
tara:strand:- start:13 stop:423 length:411 start_codon:yes stop_codon:yes gene_type:complete